MDCEFACNMLLWCMVLNVGLMILWFVMIAAGHKWIYRMHSKIFNITEEHFNAIHYGGMAVYKTFFIVFNLVPLLALQIVCGA